MRRLFSFALVFTLACTARAEPPAAVGIAVVELFTSQGCSSCPPADALLVEIGESTDGRAVFPLAFHVPYWDYLGWKDPYATEANTERQRAHNTALGTGRMYTPQMVVNGEHEFVGHRRRSAEARIAAALATAPGIDLTAKATQDGDRLSVRWTATARSDEAAADWTVVVALAQGPSAVDVPRGENARKTLRHAHVVRGFATSAFATEGTSSLRVPADFAATGAQVVVYAQDAQGRVRGAVASTI